MHLPSFDEIHRIIEKYLSTIPKENSEIEIGFFGGNFTGIPLDQQEKYLQIANEYLGNRISAIRLSTRPDYINKDVINLLKSYNVKTVELGAQSLDDEVLKESGRGHKAEDVINASMIIKNAGLNLGLQMMIGLPGDTLEKTIYTANKIVQLKADSTRIYPTLVINGTALQKLFSAGKYKPLELDEAVNWTKIILPIFENGNVDILRIGLHPSEGLLNGHELVAGPFHVSFKELVLTSIWHDLLSALEFEKDKMEITITANERELNYASGYKASNRKMLEKRFRKVRFAADPTLTKLEFNVLYS